MNKNQVVKDFEFNKSLVHKLDSILDSCCRDCHDNYFHKFKYDCIYDINLTNIFNNEITILTIADQSMNLYEINKKLKIARQIGFMFNQKIN